MKLYFLIVAVVFEAKIEVLSYAPMTQNLNVH
jgi:hypothetical protein